eukprot:gene2064-biopygen22942
MAKNRAREVRGGYSDLAKIAGAPQSKGGGLLRGFTPDWCVLCIRGAGRRRAVATPPPSAARPDGEATAGAPDHLVPGAPAAAQTAHRVRRRRCPPPRGAPGARRQRPRRRGAHRRAWVEFAQPQRWLRDTYCECTWSNVEQRGDGVVWGEDL